MSSGPDLLAIRDRVELVAKSVTTYADSNPEHEALVPLETLTLAQTIVHSYSLPTDNNKRTERVTSPDTAQRTRQHFTSLDYLVSTLITEGRHKAPQALEADTAELLREASNLFRNKRFINWSQGRERNSPRHNILTPHKNNHNNHE